MATRYLTALEYSDWHTNNVLRKHAKNRPLGQLEWRYQYTQQQPLLSCSTVEMDASHVGGGGGSRTTVKSPTMVRSTSTSDVWHEQQKVLRQLLANGGRAVTSALGRRSECRRGTEQTTNNGSAPTPGRGRPSTSLSMSSNASRPKSTVSTYRSKSSGRPKSSASSTESESFMVLTVDKDMLKTRRTHSELTNRIHAHWRPGSTNLNQGHYRRGQKRPDDVPSDSDAWLTFGGAMGEGTEGVVDAFANFKNADMYYNIGGSVGSRVAQQLRRGDRIRIGINGEVVSHDLRVKRWIKDQQDQGQETPHKEERGEREGAVEVEVKAEEDVKEEEEVKEEEAVKEEEEEEEEEEETLEEGQESDQENPPSPASDPEHEEFADLIIDSWEDIAEIPAEIPTEVPIEVPKELPTEVPREVLTEDREEKAAVTKVQHSPTRRSGPKAAFVDFPLNWDDQVTRPEVKVISARQGPTNSNRENLCETHPVVYNTYTRHPPPRPRLASATQSIGYRVKQRPVSSSSSNSIASRNRLDSASSNKIRALTIDQNTEEQDQRLNDMSIEDVIQTRLEIAASSPVPGQAGGYPRSRSSLGSRSRVGEGREGERRCRSTSTFSQRGGGSRGERCVEAKRSARSSADRGSGTPRAASSYPGLRGERQLGVPRPSSSVPFQGARDPSALGSVRPVVLSSRGTPGRTDRQGSGRGPRHMTGLPTYRGPGSGVSSINPGPMSGDAHFIQISQPIRNPNSARVALASGFRSYYAPFPVNSMAASPVPGPHPGTSPPRSNTPDHMLMMTMSMDSEVFAALSRPLTPSVHGEASLRGSQDPELEQDGSSATTVQAGSSPGAGNVEDGSGEAVTATTDTTRPAAPVTVHVIQAISIPTGNELEEEDEEEVAEVQRTAECDDQKIDQVTNLMVGTGLAGH
ncbi:uncharacterized protein LOC143279827 [Babylonia areolata]|uniref:uncharacterized protein LOC143279827 n=1 Tax=Babylonia areolata TaxID=304850 RepID=UPI003FD445F2